MSLGIRELGFDWKNESMISMEKSMACTEATGSVISVILSVWAACDVEKSLHAQSALFGLIKQKAVMSASCWQNWIKPTLPGSCSALRH